MNQGPTSPAPGVAARSWVRGTDRRSALAGLLAAITRCLQQQDRETFALRKTFEQCLTRILPLRWAEIRDAPVGSSIPRPAPDIVTVPVPTSDPARPITLQTRVEPGRALGDWDHQVLHALSHVAALVVEIEHAGARPRPNLTLAAVRADGAAPLIGSSPAMRALRERIERVAATDFTVLIEGESGTGKELVARHVHDLSRRTAGPFVAINCAALVETLLEAELFGIEERTATGVRGRRGKFEHADGGTLFLDEVSDLSMSAQAKLLRAIQDLSVERVGSCGARRVDARIVVATNRSLSELADRGLFRQDLFYRLSGVEIRVPPLRTRREDILELANYFLGRHRTVRRLELTPGAADALLLYEWPGNVRELERITEGIVALAHNDQIDLDDLPPAIRGDYADILLPSLTRGETLRAWGSRYARLILERCAQNKRQACRKLGISYHTLQAYLRYHPAQDGAGCDDVAEWPEETPGQLALCRVAESADDRLSGSGGTCRGEEEGAGAVSSGGEVADRRPAGVIQHW
jgi:DNA-binding NtrC family response regulator